MTTDTTTDRLAAIEARVAAATQGPWEANDAVEYRPRQGPFDDCGASVWSTHEGFTDVVAGGMQDEQGGAVGVLRNADAVFIAHAREDIPWLLSEIDRLTTELDTTRVVLRDLMMTALQNGGDSEELLAACRRAFGYLDDRTCVDCGGRDDLRHFPAGLAGTGPTLTLCAACRAERKRTRQNGGAE